MHLCPLHDEERGKGAEARNVDRFGVWGLGFPSNWGYHFGGPQDYSILEFMLGSPSFGHPPDKDVTVVRIKV